MAAPEHIQIRWNGTFSDAATSAPWEIWSMGLSLAPGAGAGTRVGLQGLADAMGAPWDLLAPRVTPRVRLTEIKVSLVRATGFVGRDAAGAFIQGESVQSRPGTATGPEMPSQVSVAVSTVSAFDGAVGRGRFFVPGPASTALVEGQMAPAGLENFAASAGAFVNAVDDAAQLLGYGPVVIASGGSVTKNIPPALRVVLQVKVGSRFDVIRSRSNALDERYVTRDVL